MTDANVSSIQDFRGILVTLRAKLPVICTEIFYMSPCPKTLVYAKRISESRCGLIRARFGAGVTRS